MRIVSLNNPQGDAAEVEADICIVGAGAAGLYLAHRLATIRSRVVVLEAGPNTPVSAAEIGLESAFSGEPYSGASEGRAFGLGGTTSRWGGQLIPFQPTDGIREDVPNHRVWQRILAIIGHHRHSVARILDVRKASDTADSVLAESVDPIPSFRIAGLSPVLSWWLPFRKRNFSWLARRTGSQYDTGDIYCDAVASRWELQKGTDGSCRISGLVARSASGQTMRVSAKRYVIAAGAIESARIVQEIDAAGDGRVIPSGVALGRGLSDHLSFRVGEFGGEARSRIANAFGPFFSNGCMCTWRFLESNPAPGSRRFFSHVLFPFENPGFQLARSVLQGIQAHRMPAIGLKDLGRGSLGVLNLAWSRWIQSRLYIPPDSPCYLQLDMEQGPDSHNSVRLGTDVDRFGRPVAKIAWKVSSQDELDMAEARSSLLSRWKQLGQTFSVQPLSQESVSGAKPHDAYHPVGTCRLGDDPTAVVGFDLKVRGTENLFVLSTALFPSAGSANPTFTLLCFAEMLAGELAKDVSA